MAVLNWTLCLWGKAQQTRGGKVYNEVQLYHFASRSTEPWHSLCSLQDQDIFPNIPSGARRLFSHHESKPIHTIRNGKGLRYQLPFQKLSCEDHYHWVKTTFWQWSGRSMLYAPYNSCKGQELSLSFTYFAYGLFYQANIQLNAVSPLCFSFQNL